MSSRRYDTNHNGRRDRRRVCSLRPFPARVPTARPIRQIGSQSKAVGIPVRQAWNDQGGLFGWLHGFGARDRDTDRVRRIEEIERSGYWAGGGGWYSSEILRMRLWNEIRREGMKVKDDPGERPGMWEVGLGEGKVQESVEELEDEKRLDTYHPFIDRTYPHTAQIRQIPALPVVRLSLLIALPTSAVSANLLEELPELVIGSTLLSPTIPKTRDGIADPPMGSRKEKEDKEMEVAHLEYGSGSFERRKSRLDKARGSVGY